MEKTQLQELLLAVSRGEISAQAAASKINSSSYSAIEDFAKLDLDRETRTGFSEVIFGEGKTPDQIAVIFQRLMVHSDQVMATRIRPEIAEFVKLQVDGLVYHPKAKILYLDRKSNSDKKPGITVVSAGTADVPIAEEAAVTAELMGNRVERIFDVGVAGLHRLLNFVPELEKAKVIIVVAGMEGALVSVVGGLVSCPIVAVPTSIGYGASFHGVAALLAMLNSCASGVSVVNIDNGFGAGVVASRINRLAGESE
jgi:pyridinium-3,5-biscarboxylic acid mononucleotide synthase